MKEINSKTTLKNMLWRLAERVGARGVEFIVSIVLARLLAPEVYGSVALVTVFITLLQVFVDSGLGNALIQKKDIDDIDYSTVFYFNILFCLVLYIVLFLVAPLIAGYYDDLELTSVIRVLGITIIVSGIKNVQQAFVSRNMMFHRFFYATLGGTIGAAILGIILAYKGYGIWALVVQQVFNVSVDTLILWLTVNWRPKKVFSLVRLKALFSFGWKLLVSQLLDTFYEELRQLIIGKKYSKADLAYFNRASIFPRFIVSNINTSINSVLFPAMSSVQDDHSRIKAMTRRAIKTSTYIMAPMMMGLAACGESIIRIILTEKWLPVVPFLYIFCITYMFYPIHTSNLNAIKALGRSDLFLRLEIIKKIIGLVVLLISMRISVMAMAYSLLFTNVTSQIINSWPNKQLLHYSYLEQLKDIMPSIILSIVMGILVYSISMLRLNDYITLIIQIPLGVVIYIVGSKIIRIDSFDYVLSMVKSFIHRKEEFPENKEI